MKPASATHFRTLGCVASLNMTIMIAGCTFSVGNTISNEFIRQAEPGVTLTALTAKSDRYQGKVVILGGVPLVEIQEGDRLWLWLRNRPLDANYVAHLPPSRGGSEDGHFWVLVSPQDSPPISHTWARVTVVGRVLPRPFSAPPQVLAESEPVLSALYIHAQPVNESGADTWQSRHDLQYMNMRGGDEPSQGHCWTCSSLYGGE